MVIYNFFKNLLLNRKYTKIIKSVYKDDDMLNKLSQLFGSEFRIDWVGRIYTVLNPNIVDDKLDVNTQIFEYGENGLSNSVYLERYIMTKLNMIKDFVIANNLFDLFLFLLLKGLLGGTIPFGAICPLLIALLILLNSCTPANEIRLIDIL